MVQQATAIALLESGQFSNEIGELLAIKPVDVREFPHFDRIFPVMRQTVMPLGHAYLAEAAVAPVVGKQKGGNSRKTIVDYITRDLVLDDNTLSDL